jgi:hypothetical protein
MFPLRFGTEESRTGVGIINVPIEELHNMHISFLQFFRKRHMTPHSSKEVVILAY